MTAADLPQVNDVADRVHVNYPEDPQIFAERQRLYSQGCYVLGDGSRILGYIISHPWHFGQPPSLNSLLEAIPGTATTYYIHDIALVSAARRLGQGGNAVRLVAEHARDRGFSNISLVAVNDSTEFWRRHGFAIVADPALTEKLLSYGEGACFMARDLHRETR